MPRDFSRTERVADVIQRELARLIPREVQDPRLGSVTVSAVRVTRDLGHAKVYVSSIEGPEAAMRGVEILNHAAGFLRHVLAQQVSFRTTPRLHFVFDESIERGARLSALIDAAVGHGKPEPGE